MWVFSETSSIRQPSVRVRARLLPPCHDDGYPGASGKSVEMGLVELYTGRSTPTSDVIKTRRTDTAGTAKPHVDRSLLERRVPGVQVGS